MQKLAGKWLCAVSGGPDSMALLGMCLEAGIDCAVAHVNYHHRSSADEEEAYVRSFCDAHHIDCYVRSEPFQWEGNFEAAAREWRYDFFVKLVKEKQFAGVLIAHQEDDLLETYMMQEEKNLVPAYYGLKEENMYHGILVKRPLLKDTKKDLEEYCISHQIRYYVDETNADDTYARNKVRKETVGPMTRFERDMILHEIASKNAMRQERKCRVNTMIQVDRVNLDQYRALSEDDRSALLRMVIEPEERGNSDALLEKESSISLLHSKEIDHILMTQDDFEIPVHGQYLVQQGHFFFLHPGFHEYQYTLKNEKDLTTLGRQECFAVEAGSPGIYAVTLKDEDYPLLLRNFNEGDAISLRYGQKKVSRFLIDRKIPKYLRRTWPVLCDQKNNVIFVPGIGCDVLHFSDRPTVNVIQYPLIKEIF